MQQSNQRRKISSALTLAVAAVALAAGSAIAQEAPYPNRPVRIVVGFAAGAFNDIMVRTITPKLGERLGQPVVVENRPGAGGNVGAEAVARAPADGYTLLVAPTSTLAINPALYSKLNYDPQRDFTSISQLANFTTFLTTRGNVPIKTVAELVGYAKANPDKANFGSVAPVFEMITAMLTQRTGAKFVTIPFKSTAETMTALLNGQALISYQDYNSMRAHLAADKVRPLVALSTQRSVDLPQVPTRADIGLAGLEFDSFTGIVAPRATPAALVKRLSDEVQAVMKDSDVLARWKQLGISPVGSSAEAFGKVMLAELKRWQGIQKATGIKLIDAKY